MLAVVAALMFLIALIIEIVHYTTLDTPFLTLGFLLVALYLAELGPRGWRHWW
ncbi:MAG TPA: hypothetical protein VFE65_14285 [Pseudonocardia sp.]|jgi:hypothetical protein|nr:hypothetical protein [Pseudonocardia sp.]